MTQLTVKNDKKKRLLLKIIDKKFAIDGHGTLEWTLKRNFYENEIKGCILFIKI